VAVYFSISGAPARRCLGEDETMAGVGLADAVGTAAHTSGDPHAAHCGDGESTLIAMLRGEHPMTLWAVAARLGDSYGERALSVIEELTAAGKLARFRAGLTEYYASPRVALTGSGPSLGTVIADSVTGLILRNRRRLARRAP
jgi:hypothetical protein